MKIAFRTVSLPQKVKVLERAEYAFVCCSPLASNTCLDAVVLPIFACPLPPPVASVDRLPHPAAHSRRLRHSRKLDAHVPAKYHHVASEHVDDQPTERQAKRALQVRPSPVATAIPVPVPAQASHVVWCLRAGTHESPAVDDVRSRWVVARYEASLLC